jgi:hypothetical protein
MKTNIICLNKLEKNLTGVDILGNTSPINTFQIDQRVYGVVELLSKLEKVQRKVDIKLDKSLNMFKLNYNLQENIVFKTACLFTKDNKYPLQLVEENIYSFQNQDNKDFHISKVTKAYLYSLVTTVKDCNVTLTEDMWKIREDSLVFSGCVFPNNKYLKVYKQVDKPDSFTVEVKIDFFCFFKDGTLQIEEFKSPNIITIGQTNKGIVYSTFDKKIRKIWLLKDKEIIEPKQNVIHFFKDEEINISQSKYNNILEVCPVDENVSLLKLCLSKGSFIEHVYENKTVFGQSQNFKKYITSTSQLENDPSISFKVLYIIEPSTNNSLMSVQNFISSWNISSLQFTKNIFFELSFASGKVSSKKYIGKEFSVQVEQELDKIELKDNTYVFDYEKYTKYVQSCNLEDMKTFQIANFTKYKPKVKVLDNNTVIFERYPGYFCEYFKVNNVEVKDNNIFFINESKSTTKDCLTIDDQTYKFTDQGGVLANCQLQSKEIQFKVVEEDGMIISISVVPENKFIYYSFRFFDAFPIYLDGKSIYLYSKNKKSVVIAKNELLLKDEMLYVYEFNNDSSKLNLKLNLELSNSPLLFTKCKMWVNGSYVKKGTTKLSIVSCKSIYSSDLTNYTIFTLNSPNKGTFYLVLSKDVSIISTKSFVQLTNGINDKLNNRLDSKLNNRLDSNLLLDVCTFKFYKKDRCQFKNTELVNFKIESKKLSLNVEDKRLLVSSTELYSLFLNDNIMSDEVKLACNLSTNISTHRTYIILGNNLYKLKDPKNLSNLNVNDFLISKDSKTFTVENAEVKLNESQRFVEVESNKFLTGDGENSTYIQISNSHYLLQLRNENKKNYVYVQKIKLIEDNLVETIIDFESFKLHWNKDVYKLKVSLKENPEIHLTSIVPINKLLSLCIFTTSDKNFITILYCNETGQVFNLIF